jgi:hypothetical protein
LENGTVERKVGLGKGSNSGGTCLPQPLGDVRNWLPVGCVNLAADGTFSDSWTLAAYPIGGDAKAGPQPLPLGGDKNKIAMIYDLAVRSPDCLLVLSSDGLRCVIGAPKGKPK